MGRSIRQWALLCCTVLTPALCFGQLDLFPGAAKTGSPGKPKFATTIAPAAAAPGEEVTLSISVKLPKGYYIYATSGDFGGRTKIETNPVGLEAVDSEFVPKDAAKEVFDTALNAATNKDTILDFNPANDTIRLDNAIFTTLSAGTLQASGFYIGTAAHDADDRIIYNRSTGQVSYDADGNGAGAAVAFAVINNKAALTNADFFIV